MSKFGKRDEYENARFCEYISNAIDHARRGIANISYAKYPELNENEIKQIKQACQMLEDVLDNVNNLKEPL